MTRLLADEFDAVARRVGARAAVVEDGVALSYDGLLRWSQAISVALERHRCMDGRPGALVLPNSAGFVASFFAVARSLGVVAPLHVEYRSQELEHYLGDIRPSAVLTCAEAVDRVREALRHLDMNPGLILVDTPGALDAWPPGDVENRPPTDMGGEPPALLLYTSGSTGTPKRVVRSHQRLLGEIDALRALFDITPEDRFLGATPFCHVNGLVRTMLTGMLAGATIYPLRAFVRRPVLELVTRERLTFLGGVPYMFVLLAETPPRSPVDLSSLRILFSSSAPLNAADNRAFHKAYGLFVRQLYGSSETGTISYNSHPWLEERLESVGRPLPGISLAVVDERRRPGPPGHEGQVAVASPYAVSAYEGNPAATARSFHDGVYLTGDLGRLDSEGYLTLTGRTSLLINRGGYKVNPHEVEEVIRQYPKVSEVVVAGAPGPHGDEIIRCVVVAKSPCRAEEIILHCQDRIAAYKIPGRIEFRDSLPKTTTGKYRRGAL